MKVLCIGGTNDGRRVNITSNMPVLFLPAVTPRLADTSPQGTIERYWVESLTSGDRDIFYIAVFDDLSFGAALNLLLERYPLPASE